MAWELGWLYAERLSKPTRAKFRSVIIRNEGRRFGSHCQQAEAGPSRRCRLACERWHIAFAADPKWQGATVWTNRVFRSSELRPEEIKRLQLAYKYALRSLSLVDRNDPLTNMLAKNIIQVGATEHNPWKISEIAVKRLGIQ